MNDENLQTIVDAQAKEIAELKNKLSQTDKSDFKTEIVAFYKRKYLEMFDEVYNNRLDLIAGEIANIEHDIEKYSAEEQKLNIREDANKENLEEQAKIEKELADKYIQLEETRFSYDNKITAIQNEAIKLYMIYSDYIEKYRELLTEYEIASIDQDTFLFSIYDVVKKVITEGYQISVELRQKEMEVTATINLEEKSLESLQQEIQVIKTRLEALKETLHEISLEEHEQIRNDLKQSEKQKEVFKTEIEALYEKKKLEHLKTIQDEAIRFGFLGYASVQMSEAFEDQLVIFRQELLSIDTSSNKTYQKEKREKMLKEELKKLRSVDEERENKEAEYNYLKNIYNDVMKKIKDIEEYNSRLMNTISSKAQYRDYLDAKKAYETDKAELVSKIKEQNKNYTMLQDKRRIAVCDPFSKTPLSEIDEEIIEAKKELDKIVALYKEKEQKYTDLSNNDLNIRIFKLIKQKEDNEKHLDTFYQQLKELKEIIDNKYDEVQELKEQLKEYQNVLMQLEELKNENKD